MSEEFNPEMLPEEEVKYAEEVIPVTRVKIIWDEYSKLGPIGKDRYLKSVQSISNFDDIKINGKDPAMINISDNGLIDIALDITISNRHDIYLAIMIYDGTNLVASYSSKSGSGKVFRLAEGQHNLQDMFYVPNNLVNGDYYLTVQINDANGGFLARMSRIVQLKKIGYISKYTGVSFTKSNSGYFAITDEN